MIKANPKYLLWLNRSLPNFLWPVKWFLTKRSLKSAGSNFHFDSNSILIDPRFIEVGNNVFFGANTVINTTVPVIIGNNVMFGPEVMIMGGDHNFSKVGIFMRDVKDGGKNEPVILENDVWIGSRALILKGVTIGEGVVVGAGSIATKSLPPYSICVGNPCKPIRCRFSTEELKLHIQLIKSKYTFDEINVHYKLWGIDLTK